MSFSGEIKEELGGHISQARHCQIAEAAAYISMCGSVMIDSNDRFSIKIHTENLIVARKCFTLLEKTFNIRTEISIRRNLSKQSTIDSNDRFSIKIHTENLIVARKCFTLLEKTFNIRTEISIRRNLSKQSTAYWLLVKKHEEALRILHATKLLTQEGDVLEELSLVKNTVVQQYCCRRAFIRGAFLVSGSISDPEKSYHYEIVCSAKGKAEQLQKIMNSFEIDAKVIQRKKSYVVYVKEGAQISDLLNIMEAHVALMKFENIRILKDMRNTVNRKVNCETANINKTVSAAVKQVEDIHYHVALMKFENIRILKDMRNTVNRKVNCETANINKTVSAAVKQVEDIHYIRDTIGLENLSETLYDVALTRLTYPEATLKELGDLLTPPVGKSGVNHRLRKLGDIAEKLRQNKEVDYD